MTTWEILRAGSAAPEGSNAYELLQGLNAGGGGNIYGAEIEVEIDYEIECLVDIEDIRAEFEC